MRTVLHNAAKQGYLQICKLLISKEGCLANCVITFGLYAGYNAYQIAQAEGYPGGDHKLTAKFLKLYKLFFSKTYDSLEKNRGMIMIKVEERGCTY